MARSGGRPSSTGPLAAASSVAEIAVIRRGYAWPVAHKLQDELGLTDPRFASFLGMSSRTIARLRKSQRRLDTVASDRLYRLRHIIDLAAEVFEDRGSAMNWLKEEQPGLQYKAPLDILDTEPGFRAVETLLLQIDYAVII